MVYKIVKIDKVDDIPEYLNTLTDTMQRYTSIIPYGKNNDKFLVFTNADTDDVSAEVFKEILDSKKGRNGPSFSFNRLMDSEGQHVRP